MDRLCTTVGEDCAKIGLSFVENGVVFPSQTSEFGQNLYNLPTTCRFHSNRITPVSFLWNNDPKNVMTIAAVVS